MQSFIHHSTVNIFQSNAVFFSLVFKGNFSIFETDFFIDSGIGSPVGVACTLDPGTTPPEKDPLCMASPRISSSSFR